MTITVRKGRCDGLRCQDDHAAHLRLRDRMHDRPPLLQVRVEELATARSAVPVLFASSAARRVAMTPIRKWK